jgi:hypothetical protein
MVKVQLLLLPQRSSAVQTTGLTPHGKNEPEGGAQVTATLPLLSLATGGG